MAPSVHGELQAGHVEGSLAPPAESPDPFWELPAEVGPEAAAADGVGTCCWTAPGLPGTAKIFLQVTVGQRTVLPAALSGTCMAF